MKTISLCMIVKNEEAILDRALSSIKDVVDEIIIVDTGSTDKTKDIAFNYTNKVFDFKWNNDFAQARNYAFSKATCEYCMWLDADDVVLPKDKEALLKVKESLDGSVSVVMMKYHTQFDANDNPTFTYYRERLLRRSDNFKWEGFIHEVISPKGKIEYSDVAITHKKDKPSDSKRNLMIFDQKLRKGYHFLPRELFYYARELYYHNYYHDAIKQFTKFLNTKQGWKENNISACQFLGYCYHALHDTPTAISWLLNSLYYDTPRAEICCDLGQYFYELKAYQQAIYWYAVALSCTRDDTSGAFVLPDCYDYIPNIQLCLCYDALKQYDTANFYNELAGKCKPNDPAYLYNKKYFESIL